MQAVEEASRLSNELQVVKEQWATERAQNEKIITELKAMSCADCCCEHVGLVSSRTHEVTCSSLAGDARGLARA